MEYTLVLSEQHLAVIDRALQEAPFRLAAPVFQTINEQCLKQQEAAKEVKPEKGTGK